MTTSASTPLLVRTPAQRPDESPWGYVLRLSDVNGCTRPTALFSLLGMSREEASGLRLDCSKLAPALGENGASLRSYMSNPDGTLEFQQGGLIAAGDLAAGAGRICVECVRELGYMPAWADLRLIDACPVHKRMFATECPACDTRLTWRRPSLLKCWCEADLSEADCEEAPAEHCDLVQCLIDLSRGLGAELSTVVPPNFKNMTLGRMLGLCRALASLHLRIFSEASLSDCQRAARMLRDWPNNVYRMFDVLAASEGTSITHGGTLLRRYASTSNAQVYRLVRDVDDVAELSGVFARYTPGDPVQAKHALAIPYRERERQVKVRKKLQHRRKSPERNTMSVFDTAARLGITVSLLKYLCKKGVFEVEHASVRSIAFAPADIERFEKKVRAIPVEPRQDCETISARDFLRLQLRGDAKGMLVEAIFDGSLAVIGRQGPLLTDLVLPRAEAEERRASLRRATHGGTLSCAEAAKLLGYEPTAVASICRRGLIRCYQAVQGFRVYTDAIEEFKARYVRVADVAKEANSGGMWVVNAAVLVGVEVSRDPAYPTRHVFLRRDDVGRVLAKLREPEKMTLVKPSARRALTAGTDAADLQRLELSGAYRPRPKARRSKGTPAEWPPRTWRPS